MDRYLNIAVALLLVTTLSFGQASTEQVFFVAPERIKEIAINAAYENHPNIPQGGLVNDRSNEHVSVNCRSALNIELVTTEEQDFQHCTANQSFQIKETISTRKILNEDGLCMVEVESEKIYVQVFSDGSTIVSPPGHSRSSHSEEYTNEFEGWSE